MKKILTLLLIISNINFAKANEDCDLIYKEQKFSSQKLKSIKNQDCLFEIKAQERNKIKVCNEDNQAIEFESYSLKIEKIIGPKKSANIFLKKIEQGKIYDFEDEFKGVKCNFIGI